MTEHEPGARREGLDQPRGPAFAESPLEAHAGSLDSVIDAIVQAGQPLLAWREYRGREGRSSFGRFALLSAAVVVVGYGMDLLVFGATPSGVPPFFTAVFMLTLLPASIAVGVRRLRDTDRSGWLLLLAFAPPIGWALLALLWARPTASRRALSRASS